MSRVHKDRTTTTSLSMLAHRVQRTQQHLSMVPSKIRLVWYVPEATHKPTTVHVSWTRSTTRLNPNGHVMDRTDLDAVLHVLVAPIRHVMEMANAMQVFKGKDIARAILLTHSVPIVHSP